MALFHDCSTMNSGFGITITIIRPHRSTMCVDVAYCYRSSIVWSVGLAVCLSVTLVSPANIAEPIEMLFGLRILVGLGNRVLDGVQNQIPP